MIEQLRKQTEDTIFGFLNRLCADPAVFSAVCTDYSECLDGCTVLFFSTGSEVLQVLLDDYLPLADVPEELPDEVDFVKGVPPLWFDIKSKRISPVFLMNEAAGLFRETCHRCDLPEPAIWNLILCGHIILDYDLFTEVWDSHRTTLFHQVHDLDIYRTLPVNSGHDLPGYTYYNKYRTLRQSGDVRSLLAPRKAAIEACEKFSNFSL